MTNNRTIYVATQNEGKIKEFKAFLPEGIEMKTMKDLGDDYDIPEIGATFEENAYLKAKYLSDKYGVSAIADDSGLCVDALNGRPGVLSARYAGDHDTKANNELLLKELGHLNHIGERTAQYVAVICYIDVETGSATYFRGEIEGVIGFSGRGANGFAYDELFFVGDRYDRKSVAQMTLGEKNAISHRTIAVAKFLEFIQSSEDGVENGTV